MQDKLGLPDDNRCAERHKYGNAADGHHPMVPRDEAIAPVRSDRTCCYP